MIAIYKSTGMDGFELCHPVHSEDFETINLLVNGESRATTWQAIAMKMVDNDQGNDLKKSDAPWLGGHALIFRRSVIDALTIISECGELLPVSCAQAEVFVFNPTQVIDALIESESSFERLSTGRIWMIRDYVFSAEKLCGIDIFKIPNFRVSPTFVSQRFVDLWRDAGLKGLAFDLVWSSQ